MAAHRHLQGRDSLQRGRSNSLYLMCLDQSSQELLLFHFVGSTKVRTITTNELLECSGSQLVECVHCIHVPLPYNLSPCHSLLHTNHTIAIPSYSSYRSNFVQQLLGSKLTRESKKIRTTFDLQVSQKISRQGILVKNASIPTRNGEVNRCFNLAVIILLDCLGCL